MGSRQRHRLDRWFCLKRPDRCLNRGILPTPSSFQQKTSNEIFHSVEHVRPLFTCTGAPVPGGLSGFGRFLFSLNRHRNQRRQLPHTLQILTPVRPPPPDQSRHGSVTGPPGRRGRSKSRTGRTRLRFPSGLGLRRLLFVATLKQRADNNIICRRIVRRKAINYGMPYRRSFGGPRLFSTRSPASRSPS